MYGDQNPPIKKYFQVGFLRNGHLQVEVNQGCGVTPGGCYWCIKMILYRANHETFLKDDISLRIHQIEKIRALYEVLNLILATGAHF